MRFPSAIQGIVFLCLATEALACAKGTSLAAGGSGGVGGTTNTTQSAGPTGTTNTVASQTSSTPSSNATTSQATTNATSSTATTAVTSATTNTTATTAMASTSTGPACSESPCKLTSPQCGCSAGAMCSIIGANRNCITAGSQAIGQACSPTNDCSPGSICIAPKTTYSCLKFCSSDADCVAPGGICYFTVSDGAGGTVPNAMMCSQNCDPSSATSCVVNGLSCQAGTLMTSNKTLTYCAEAGSGANNAACPNGSTDCQAGYGCFNSGTSNICAHWCKFPSGSGCPAGTSCLHFQTPMFVGTTEYGVCA